MRSDKTLQRTWVDSNASLLRNREFSSKQWTGLHMCTVSRDSLVKVSESYLEDLVLATLTSTNSSVESANTAPDNRRILSLQITSERQWTSVLRNKVHRQQQQCYRQLNKIKKAEKWWTDESREPQLSVGDKDVVFWRSTLERKQNADALTQLVDLMRHVSVALVSHQCYTHMHTRQILQQVACCTRIIWMIHCITKP